MAEMPALRVDATPNPNSLKFTADRALWEGRAQTFSDPMQALASPLARELLGVVGVRSVFFLRDFITVTREPSTPWEPIVAQVEEILRRHLSGGPD
jgi:hypothetical protein